MPPPALAAPKKPLFMGSLNMLEVLGLVLGRAWGRKGMDDQCSTGRDSRLLVPLPRLTDSHRRVQETIHKWTGVNEHPRIQADCNKCN